MGVVKYCLRPDGAGLHCIALHPTWALVKNYIQVFDFKYIFTLQGALV
jgi:hypothetical protein